MESPPNCRACIARRLERNGSSRVDSFGSRPPSSGSEGGPFRSRKTRFGVHLGREGDRRTYGHAAVGLSSQSGLHRPALRWTAGRQRLDVTGILDDHPAPSSLRPVRSSDACSDSSRWRHRPVARCRCSSAAGSEIDPIRPARTDPPVRRPPVATSAVGVIGMAAAEAAGARPSATSARWCSQADSRWSARMTVAIRALVHSRFAHPRQPGCGAGDRLKGSYQRHQGNRTSMLVDKVRLQTVDDQLRRRRRTGRRRKFRWERVHRPTSPPFDRST